MQVTREELIKMFNRAGIEYFVAKQDGGLLQVNFWVEDKKDA